ncbi:hypothetical protein D3D02_15605 [Halobellus sp. Atlit-38R]|nr:hypothetical protein D3D02_15605 [Halobellus sp. Atlit-38R]
MGVILNEEAVARTYAHQSVADTYDVVEQYRAAMRYPDDASSTHIARELEIPRGRVRPWLDGAKPDAVRAIEIATAKNWFSNDWTQETQALAVLCAGVFACGSIEKQGYRPTWTPETAQGRTQLETALENVGVGVRVETEDRTRELWPGTHGSILGRCLMVAGAPTGNKTATTVTSLPQWLDDAPAQLRETIAELFVRERAIAFEDKATRRIQSARPPSYYRALAALIEDVTDESVTYSESGITISADAVRALGLA